jgi:hypothetical protein
MDRLGRDHPQRTAPVLRVEHEGEMEQEPRLAGLQVANLLGVHVGKVALRGVMHDEHVAPGLARALRRALGVTRQQLLEGDLGVVHDPVRPLEVGRALQTHRQRGRWLPCDLDPDPLESAVTKTVADLGATQVGGDTTKRFCREFHPYVRS